MLRRECADGYIVSKEWLERWKSHVGYEEACKGMEGSGRKFGRTLPGRMNDDLVVKEGYDEE